MQLIRKWMAGGTLFALGLMCARADDVATVPTEPVIVGFDKISSGDTAWMLTSSALVLMMTIPGLALFYGGMVRKKNVLATLVQSFAITCLVTILWWLVGYSLAFTPGTPGSTRFIGGLAHWLMNGVVYRHDAMQLSVSHLGVTIPETVYAMFQLTFAIITPALICGAFAERMKFSAMLWFMGLWLLLVYCPVAHWVWEPSGWLAQKGVLDFAGGTVVHINAGIAGLAAAIMLGKRQGLGRESMAPHNLTYTVIGASLLWVGWFGFNAGSAVAADGRAGMAFAATQIATAVTIHTIVSGLAYGTAGIPATSDRSSSVRLRSRHISRHRQMAQCSTGSGYTSAAGSDPMAASSSRRVCRS